MKNLAYIVSIFIFLLATQSIFADEIRFNSGPKQVSLLELYTSQGCSSCPPADKWLSKLEHKDGLWSEFVPVAFHVTYWNYLGWSDRFSKKEFSERQRLHKQQGNVGVVYTPGFFLNGKEWRRKFGLHIPKSKDVTGEINAVLNDHQLSVEYKSNDPIHMPILNIGILGFGFESQIGAGENSNRVLKENFVILSHLKFASTSNTWVVELPSELNHMAEKYGLALWVSEGNNLVPLQATGGWLPVGYYN